MEKNFGPLSQWVSSLVEIFSLMKAASPLNKFLVLWCSFLSVLVGSEVSIIKLLFPALDVGSCSGVKESVIGSLEFTLTKGEDLVSGVNTLGLSLSSLSFALAETEGVDSVWTLKEACFAWVSLHVFPAGVRPSAGDQLQILLWDAIGVGVGVGVEELAARV